ncbi:hypothetical protein RvY_18901 [Ramazzottius varieornatus]|uniref:Uncharacterized protein n=1 Tax=Ramazzottius varieornatus TaxID=947166 RepID=A0A1D1W7P7_RAMVA|nr:hypothetical protein RvY_18901 [Ramazzottius varieornatus]
MDLLELWGLFRLIPVLCLVLFSALRASEAAPASSLYGPSRSIGFTPPSLGYGGGLSFSANLHPYDLRNPIDYAYGLAFGYGLNGIGQQLSNTIVSTGSGGNGAGNGNGFGGVYGGIGYGGGNANTLLPSYNGYSQAFTNNVAFSGNQGNGYGQGTAVGQVAPTAWGNQYPGFYYG